MNRTPVHQAARGIRLLGLGLLAMGAASFSACQTQSSESRPDVSVTPGPETPFEPTDMTLGRDRRRMDIDQLSASLQTVSGGLVWKGLRTENRFEELAATLGKADYATNTQEDLAPSLLFQKFLDDAASDICAQAVTREQGGGLAILAPTAGLDATWEQKSDAIEADLSTALLRFHGREFAVGSPELEPWTWLFRTTHEVTQDGPRTWRSVCVALFTHPDFYTY
ncbi:MAG: hypothetical protein AB8H79_04105 [Myxococcota bacterium]